MDTRKIERSAVRAMEKYIVLKKGKITPSKIVDDLITKIEGYANCDFDYFQMKRHLTVCSRYP